MTKLFQGEVKSTEPGEEVNESHVLGSVALGRKAENGGRTFWLGVGGVGI
jgi:hypothetical protein